MKINLSAAYYPLILRSIFLCSVLALPAVAQETNNIDQIVIEASEPPKSILFPSDMPGPYFPDNAAELAQQESLAETQNVIVPSQANQMEQTGIDVAELSSIDLSLFGILNGDDGGFAKNIWSNSEPDKIEHLLNILNLPVKSPAMDDISRKLLLSSASAPKSGEILQDELEPEAFDELAAKKFINLRIAKLIDRGNLSDLIAFVQSIPQNYLDVSMRNAEVLMLGGDLMGACQMTQQARADGMELTLNNDHEASHKEEMLFWLKMLTYCRTLEGDIAGAQIALDLLNEQGSLDFTFFDLINLLMEDPDNRRAFMSSNINRLDPLNYSLLSLLEQPIDEELIENSPPLILSALVINPNMSKESRLQGALKSYLVGGISVDILRAIYDLQEFSIIEYENAVLLSQSDDRPMADVLLYQAAAKENDDVQKAEILKAIWQRAMLNNDLPRQMKLNIETLKSLTPSRNLIIHADHIARGLLLCGEITQAKIWYNFVRQYAVNGDATATSALINLWPLIITASEKGTIVWNDDILDLWWNGQMVLSPENRDSKAALFYAVVEAFQYEVSEEKWAELIVERRAENSQAIPLGVWRELIRSARQNKPGQAIILSLIAMGKNGPGSLDPSGISAVIRTLRNFGLEQEARNVALEALVINDF